MKYTLGPARSLADSAEQAPSLNEALSAGVRILREILGVAAIRATLISSGGTLSAFSGSADAQRGWTFSTAHGSLSMEFEIFGAAQADVEALTLVLLLALQHRLSRETLDVDPLTGVFNRRGFENGLRERWDAACITGQPLAIAILDVDFFKLYNDRYGHTAGDAVLRRVAHAASATLQRGEDRFARYGGEEFVAVFAGTELPEAIKVAERMRAAVAALGIPHAGGKGGRVTVSVGVAAARTGDLANGTELVQRADAQLYRSKAEGRDRVCAEGYGGEQGASDAIPQPYSALVGRDAELQRIREALQAHRTVTITGTAGVGKTRLALAVAADEGQRFSTVLFIDMWAAVDAGDLLTRMQPALDTGSGALVVLNGCEHAREVSRAAIETAAKANVSVLATARVPLEVAGEQVIRIQPLDQRAARELLEDRARVAGVLVQFDDTLAANLLRRLGGIPLAIELAAARLRTASMSELLQETAAGNVTEDGERITLQSLLQAAIASLPHAEAAALAGAALFAGSFSSADACAVIPIPDLDERAADGLLRTLHAHSLVDAASHDGVTRWSTIAPVREAAADHARTRNLHARAVESHLEWCTARFTQIESRQGRVENRSFVAEIQAIDKDINCALERALAEPALLDRGAALCILAARYWFAAGRLSENKRWCERYLDAVTNEGLRLRLTVALARNAYAQGHISEMESYAAQAYELSAGDDRARAQILNYQGIGAKIRGEFDVAEQAFRQSGEINAEIGNVRGEAIALASLGSIAMDVRVDFAAAIPLFRKAIAMFREIGDDLNAIVIISNLVESLACAGYAGDAAVLSERAVREARWFDNAATLLLVLSTHIAAHEIAGNPSAVRDAVVEALNLPPRVDESSYYILFDMAARYLLMSGQYGMAALLFAASEWAQIRRGEPLLPVHRYHRERQLARLREYMSDRELDEASERAREQPEEAVLQKARGALLL